MSLTEQDKADAEFMDWLEVNNDRIMDSLENTPAVVKNLHESEVISDEELRQIISKPSRLTQKKMILRLIKEKGLEKLKHVIHALKKSDNNYLESIFKLLHKGKHQGIVDPAPAVEDTDWDWTADSSKPQHSFTEIDLTVSHSNCNIIEVTCPRNGNFIELFTAASKGDYSFLKKLIKSKDAELRPCDNCLLQTKGQTLLHAAAKAKSSSDAFNCIDLILKKTLREFNVRDETMKHCIIQNMWAQQDDLGQTAIHLAALNERARVVEHLYTKYNCDLLIQNKNGDTALDIIILTLPNIAWHILCDETLPYAGTDGTEDSLLEAEFDFGRIIGYGYQPQTVKVSEMEIKSTMETINEPNQAQIGETYSELQTLAKLVYSDKEPSFTFLYHVIVKTFVDLKWNLLSPYLYFHMGFKMLMYIWYTLFVVHVFLAKCPISSEENFSPDVLVDHADSTKNGLKNSSIFTYLFGDWRSAAHALSGFYGKQSESLEDDPACNFQFHFQPFIFLLFGVISTTKEFFEALLLNEMRYEGKRCGLAAYFASWENRFQILFNILMTLIGTLTFQTSVPHYYYSYAALSIVVVWVLIFIQVGTLLGQGIYVELLGQIVKRFVTLMLNYLCWIVSFSIALSILFPQEKTFTSLPRSVLRVIIMMTGELDYQDTLYGTDDDDNNSNNNDTEVARNGYYGPVTSTLFTAQVIFMVLALLLTIVISNALVGLIVSDVEDLLKKCEVSNRAIRVTQMYSMEAALLKLRRIICPIFENTFDHIFVVPPKGIWNSDGNPTGNGMVLKGSMTDLNISKELVDEIRAFASNKEAYKYKKYTQVAQYVDNAEFEKDLENEPARKHNSGR